MMAMQRRMAGGDAPDKQKGRREAGLFYCYFANLR
jgi:hypothetical protein